VARVSDTSCPVACPKCTYRWPLGAYWRVWVGRHKCEDHEHHTYLCQNCRYTLYDPKLTNQCQPGLRHVCTPAPGTST
jgi:hypothetical protein